MPIDTSVPYSDGWTLALLYQQLRKQQSHCEAMYQRYRGNPPLPSMNENQKEAVQWFIRKSRTNLERLICKAVQARLRVRGIRTAVDPDEGGDAEAFSSWKRSRGKMWSKEAHGMALQMGRAFVMVGKDDRSGKLLVTAEDPRHVTVMTDAADPMRVESGIKLIFDPVQNKDIVWLYRLDEDDNGNERVRVRRATRSRSVSTPMPGYLFDANAFEWDIYGDPQAQAQDFIPAWLQPSGGLEAMVPIVPFVNEDGMAEFEPHIELLDRITHQILQRMTIATIQAFRQRAMKGLPKTDPKTGEEIDYDSIFIAEPGAIWNIPAAVEIWESGEVNLQGILLSIRDDVKDLAAVSGTPLYAVTPDVANGSAEGASLQREQMTFKVEDRQDFWELPHERVAELIFRTLADIDAENAATYIQRADPGGIEIMWAPADRSSMSERANAIAQTRDRMPVYMQLTEIWGLAPDQADRAMTMLQEDMTRDAAFAAASKPAPVVAAAPAGQPGNQLPNNRPAQPQEQRPPAPAPAR